MPLSHRSAHPSALTAVEVFSAFDDCWYRGYEINDVVVDQSGVVGYHLVRLSDGSVPPALFKATDIRWADPGCAAGEIRSRAGA